MSVQELYCAAMKLPPEERYELAALILDEEVDSADFSFDVEAPEVTAEMQRRLADRSGVVPWQQLRAE